MMEKMLMTRSMAGIRMESIQNMPSTNLHSGDFLMIMATLTAILNHCSVIIIVWKQMGIRQKITKKMLHQESGARIENWSMYEWKSFFF